MMGKPRVLFSLRALEIPSFFPPCLMIVSTQLSTLPTHTCATRPHTHTHTHPTSRPHTHTHPLIYNTPRFVPDTEDIKLRSGTYRTPKPSENFEQWMLRVTTKEVGIEVNIQISEFTLQNHKMMLLDPTIMRHKDFDVVRRTVLRGQTDVACAEVCHTTK